MGSSFNSTPSQINSHRRNIIRLVGSAAADARTWSLKFLTMARNIEHHHRAFSLGRRETLLGQKGCVVWLTGLSGSGKSTVAHGAEYRLVKRGVLAYVLDGDDMRTGLNADLGFTPEDRNENVRRVGEVAALFADAGVITIAALISPYRRERDRVRGRIGEGRFLEVYLDAPIEICERRDPKGLYRKAREGTIRDFTGISAPYEPPERPDLVLRTGEMDADACADEVVSLLLSRNLLSPPSPEASPR